MNPDACLVAHIGQAAGFWGEQKPGDSMHTYEGRALFAGMKLLRSKLALPLQLILLTPLLVHCVDSETSSSGQSSGQLCTNSCEYADDGFCDDGGEDSDYDECALGSDCRDCGPREANDNPQPSGGTLRVENDSTNLSIGAVSAGPCGGQESKEVVFQGQIFAGSATSISLSPGCYDVTAGDAFFQRTHEQFGIVINANSTTAQSFALN